MKILLVLCLASAALAGPLKDSLLFEPWNKSGDGFIVGGRPAQDGETPWQVSIQRGSFHFCGGTIINENFIVTAAHCTAGLSASQLQIRYNSLKSNVGGQTVKVKAIFAHSEYSVGARYNNDIAVLQLSTNLILGTPNAQAISLASPGSDASSGQLIISGWGDLREGAQVGTTTLQITTVPVISRANCASQYKGVFDITENMICAGLPEGGKDTCQGDSGGPAVLNGQLVGVVSFGKGCARAGNPGVYTRVSNYIGWLKSKGVPL